MKKHIAILLLALLLPACRPAPPPDGRPSAGQSPAPLSATDADGRLVTLPAPPETILVTGRASTLPADALFLFPEIRPRLNPRPTPGQGLSQLFDLLLPRDPSAPSALPLPDPSVENIAALRPSLVVAKAGFPVADRLQTLGIPVFTLSLETIDDWLRELPALGTVLGQPDRAAALADAYRSRLDAVSSALSAPPLPAPLPRVLLLNVSAADGPLAFSIPPDDWLQTDLVERAGALPVWKGSGLSRTSWSRVSFEQIAAWNPDFVFFASFKSPLAPLLDALRDDPRWQALPAMRASRCLPLPADVASYAQPVSRWILCLEYLAATLHPDRFPAYSLPAAVTAFYATFYDLPPASPALQTLLQRLTP